MTATRAPIRYRSTRGQGAPVRFDEALLTGLAPDGGLFVPERLPHVPPGAWRDAADFQALARGVLGAWLEGDVPATALDTLVSGALDFPVPLVPLRGAWEGVYVLELFHGPTLSFKDFGARTMARLMNHFLEARADALTILVATSGDTGSAVADGFAGQERIRVVLLYPEGQVSPTQERQLIVRRPGVHALAVQGTFDDCQRLVKEAFRDPSFAATTLSSANSINIGRLLPQMLYYYWSFVQGGFDRAVVCVPSGNLGNLTGGVLAWQGGLPVSRFVAAHNANDFFPRYLAEGGEAFPPSVRTLSNAMDVGAPSNFERLRHLVAPEVLRGAVRGVSVTDADTKTSMRRVYEETGYVADPHTAVGLEAVRRLREEEGRDVPQVVLSTAHPAKFPEVVGEVLGFEPAPPERLGRLWEADVSVWRIAPEIDALRDVVLSRVGS